MAPDLDVIQNPEVVSQNVQLVGPAMGTGSGVEVPIPVMGGLNVPPTLSKSKSPEPGPSAMGKLDKPIPPAISVTRAAPQPLLLPTQSDIMPSTTERNDLEAGTSFSGMGHDSREAVPLRNISREDSMGSVTSDQTTTGPTSTSAMNTPIATKPPAGILGGGSPAVAEPSLIDIPMAQVSQDPLGLPPVPALVPIPAPSDDEVAELEDDEVPPATIRLVGSKANDTGKVDSSYHPDASADKTDQQRKKKNRLSKLGFGGGKSKET